MPEPITGTAVASVERALVTDDGSHMLLTCKTPDGREQTLAFPADTLQGLIMLVSQSLARAAEKRGLPPEQKPVVEAKSWLLNETADKRLVMSIRVEGGAEMSFVLPARSEQQMFNVRELLSRAEAARKAEGSTRH